MVRPKDCGNAVIECCPREFYGCFFFFFFVLSYSWAVASRLSDILGQMANYNYMYFVQLFTVIPALALTSLALVTMGKGAVDQSDSSRLLQTRSP